MQDSPQLHISSEDLLCVAGLRKSGKTTLMRNYLAHIPSKVYIIDHLSQYREFGPAGDILAGANRYDPNEELRKGLPASDPRAKLEEIAEKLHHIGNITLIIEEAELYLPQGRAIPRWTQSLIQSSRNWGVGVWMVTRRIQRLDKTFFDLAQHVFFFHCGLNSREYISNLIGRDYVIKPPRSKYNNLKYGITTLPPFNCLYYNLEEESAEIVYYEMNGPAATLKIVSKGKEAKDESKKISKTA